MPKLLDLTGMKFGRLEVLHAAPRRARRTHWRCRCICGKEVSVQTGNLMSGNSKSCGCIVSENAAKMKFSHGHTHTRIYRSWANMCQRCRNQKNDRYKDYGGRGIKICRRWNSFSNFLADMGEHPFRKAQIDRRDNDGNYTPRNCYWSTSREQNNNRRDNKRITVDGVTKTISQWAREKGVRSGTIANRIHSCRWSDRDAVEIPIITGDKRLTKNMGYWSQRANRRR